MRNAKRFNDVVTIILVIALALPVLLVTKRTYAADLLNRNIDISSAIPADTNVTNTYSFDTQTAANVGSIEFSYCSNSPLVTEPCTVPTGLNVSGAGILSESGLTGFSVSGLSTANNIIITRAPLAAVPTTAVYTFDNLTNPSTPNSTTFVRITVYDNIDATGAVVDRGSVAYAMTGDFSIGLFVPPYLTFCVAQTVALNCSTVSGSIVDFGEFSEFSPSTATTQMAAATNDPTGYDIYINGQTMTSGSNIINPLTAGATNAPGTSQFGINLRANTNPSVGANIDGVGTGAAQAGYGTSNIFRFGSGEIIAGSPLTTEFNRYTVSYLVNVSPDQAPGVYASTLTYTAVASF